MKVRISEVIKELKRRKDELKNLHSKRVRVSYVTCTEGADPILPEDKVVDVTAEIKKVNDRVTYLRGILQAANLNVMSEKGAPLGELIIRLGQLNDELSFYKRADSAEPTVRKTTYNGAEIQHTLFDIKKCRQIAEDLRKEIAELQMEIDTLNLTTLVEV